ncbi:MULTISPECIES: hypothetical protein [unclassified Carboxydocella]|uniref:hypothetical protein n=1 Tax=unclassified Carboxydocella TaxID=2685367 RepID=UPI0009AED901|nr:MULTISPECIES: hypothetical protein [unclassified Carboxydocella]GAW28499.1 hypothetical protein ULO1_10690 [Carboxydocella sp. ULO1]GAW30772.1 hypothetical protein JDF658_05370 [Carboxydocella sp. JDF658]
MTNEGHNYLTLSTGVVRKDASTTQVRINSVNLDPDDQRQITIQVFDWTTGSPTQIGTDINVTLNPNKSNSSTVALLVTVTDYEIRVKVPNDEDVIVNTFGETALGVMIGANTVLFKDLVKLSLV